jgi:ADP-ribose pyrophosphatase YjhB (NUDIX family)
MFSAGSFLFFDYSEEPTPHTFRHTLWYSFAMKYIKQRLLKTAYPLLKIYWFFFQPQTTGVRCLITHENQILLIQHSYGSSDWSVPGGGVKKQETLADAAKREIAEEVGITASDIKNVDRIFSDGEHKQDTVWIFHTEVATADFQIDDFEIMNAQWFPLDNLPPNSSPLLQQFVSLYQPEMFSRPS